MDIAVLVNLHARRASERVLRTVQRMMPEARVVATRSPREALHAIGDLRSNPPDLLVSAGGDGTAVTLITALRDAATDASFGPMAALPMALLPLGTGNGWAHALGAPRWRTALHHLGRASLAGDTLPLRRSDLLDVGGQLAPFAGSGWDAEILHDYSRFKRHQWLPRSLREGVPGYALTVASQSIPRQVLFGKRLEVELINLGAPPLVMSPEGHPARLAEDAGPGTVLYRGPMSVCGCGIAPEYGFGFRAFPFAGLVPGRFAARIYSGSIAEAVARMGQLWKGAWPLPHDHQWLLTHCRMRFSHPVAFQVGGDLREVVSEVDYRIANEKVDLLDWRAVGRMAA